MKLWCRMQFKAMQKRRFWIHVTPVNSSQSLLVMQGVAPPPQDKQGWLAARFADLPIVKHVKRCFLLIHPRPAKCSLERSAASNHMKLGSLRRALSHIHLHGVTDGDIVFVYPQMLNAKEGRDEYFLPADSDRSGMPLTEPESRQPVEHRGRLLAYAVGALSHGDAG